MPERRSKGKAPAGQLVKISVLARLSEVPAATIKHYLREGLLACALRTSRNMAFYDVALVPRVKAIKELQRTRFLPLKVIKEILDRPGGPSDDATAAQAIARTLAREATAEERTRDEILGGGMPAEELDGLRSRGLVTPVAGGGPERYRGDDASLLTTLAAARRAGLAPGMLPLDILDAYVEAISTLVRAELGLFRSGVLPRAGGDLAGLAETATLLSERLVVLLRRKLLLPMLTRILAEETSAARARSGGRRPRAPGNGGERRR
jgi:DNA-binding transcriptional MerR regulator